MDRRAATPVIGVVLLVAVTVVLGAIVAVYASDITQSMQQPHPTVSASADQTDTTIDAQRLDGRLKEFQSIEYTIRYQVGEPLDEDNLRVTVNGNRALGYTRTTPIRDPHRPVYLWAGTGTVHAGSELTIVAYWHDDTVVDSFDTGKFEDRYDVMTDGSPGVFDVSAVGTHEGRTHDVAPLERGDTVRIEWVSDDGETSIVLFEDDVA
jgi:flagellin-like protein